MTPMTDRLERSLRRLHETVGPRVGAASIHGGVIAVASGVPFTPENLARMEAAWLNDDETPREQRR